MRIVLSLIILLVGCAPKEHKEFWIDSDLKPYYDSFMREANYRNKFWHVDDLIMQFEQDMPKTKEGYVVLGNCDSNSGGTPLVSINKKTFKMLLQSEREQLVFHELGHCLLNKGHNDDVDDDGMPVSIMNKHSFDGSIYTNNREGYINELFR